MSRNYKVQNRFLFHTNIKIKIPEVYYTETVFEDVNEKYNSSSENSFIDRINKNNGNFVEVNEEMIEILEKVVHFSDMMNGEYDITIMPLIKLWGFYKKSDVRIPEKEEIDEIRKLIDYKKIIILNKNITEEENQRKSINSLKLVIEKLKTKPSFEKMQKYLHTIINKVQFINDFEYEIYFNI